MLMSPLVIMEQFNINDIDNIFYMIDSLIRENINMMVRIHLNFNIQNKGNNLPYSN